MAGRAGAGVLVFFLFDGCLVSLCPATRSERRRRNTSSSSSGGWMCSRSGGRGWWATCRCLGRLEEEELAGVACVCVCFLRGADADVGCAGVCGRGSGSRRQDQLYTRRETTPPSVRPSVRRRASPRVFSLQVVEDCCACMLQIQKTRRQWCASYMCSLSLCVRLGGGSGGGGSRKAVNPARPSVRPAMR